MKFLTTSLLMLVGCCWSLAQNSAPESYFDKDWKVTDQSNAAYYRTIEKSGNGYLVRDYYVSGKLQKEIECSEVKPNLKRHGKFVSYYENGNVQEEGRYDNSMQTGLFKSYHENGKPKQEAEYEDGIATRYLHYWTEAGEDELADGEGMLKQKSTARYDMYEAVRDFKLVTSFGVNLTTADTVYMKVEKIPEYPGGYPEMMEHIRKTLKFPASARKNGIDGTVYVSFIINKNGEVDDAHVARGFDPECDAAALDAVTQMKKWIPGRQTDFYTGKEKVVAVRFNLPIKFKLGK